jgi:heterodisulfide reductase subunit A
MRRTGIFLCTCDGRIQRGVDLDAVQNGIQEQEQNLFVTQITHACLPDGRAEIQRIISEQQVQNVVVAACPERFQGKQLRATCEAAGVRKHHFALVDWREGCADAHLAQRDRATHKAMDLVRMGIARVGNAQTVEPARTRISPHVLVIGGGIAGMTAAKELAARGVMVTLVERNPDLGGKLRDIPLNGSTRTFQETKYAVTLGPRVALYTDSQIVSAQGEVGHYRVLISHANGKTRLTFGAIIVATGTQEFRDAHLYHHDGYRIVTLREFEQQISTQQALLQRSLLQQAPPSLVYILCAGSRDAHIPYCSNVCCLDSLHQALRVKRDHPETRITILFRDLYLGGDEWNDEIALEARRAGIEFLRYAPTNPPRVEEDAVTVHDVLSGTTHRLQYDRVVLATPLIPQDDSEHLARLLHLSRDADGFFIEPHYRVRPELQTERGIFICGSAHRPVDIDNAILQGEIAAARAAHFLERREVIHPAARAFVQTDVCTGCAQCVETCAFAAIEMRASDSDHSNTNLPAMTGIRGSRDFQSPFDHAHIDPFLCLACGNCVVACPSRAIELPNASDAQIFAQLDAALGTQLQQETANRVSVVFACEWSGTAAMELAGARGLDYSAHVRVIELPCSARLSPTHVLYALLHGADHVLLALCPPDECHFINGSRFAEMRIENLRAQLSAHGMDPQRVNYARMMGDDARAWVNAVASMTA